MHSTDSLTYTARLSLSIPQPHSVGYTKAGTVLQAGPLPGYKSSELCQGGEGSHCGECAHVCVSEDDYVTHELPRLAGGCLNGDTNSGCPHLDATVQIKLLWNIPPPTPTAPTSVSCSHFRVLPSHSSPAFLFHPSTSLQHFPPPHRLLLHTPGLIP